jgi:hypothetical protein
MRFHANFPTRRNLPQTSTCKYSCNPGFRDQRPCSLSVLSIYTCICSYDSFCSGISPPATELPFNLHTRAPRFCGIAYLVPHRLCTSFVLSAKASKDNGLINAFVRAAVLDNVASLVAHWNGIMGIRIVLSGDVGFFAKSAVGTRD